MSDGETTAQAILAALDRNEALLRRLVDLMEKVARGMGLRLDE